MATACHIQFMPQAASLVRTLKHFESVPASLLYSAHQSNEQVTSRASITD